MPGLSGMSIDMSICMGAWVHGYVHGYGYAHGCTVNSSGRSDFFKMDCLLEPKRLLHGKRTWRDEWEEGAGIDNGYNSTTGVSGNLPEKPVSSQERALSTFLWSCEWQSWESNSAPA